MGKAFHGGHVTLALGVFRMGRQPFRRVHTAQCRPGRYGVDAYGKTGFAVAGILHRGDLRQGIERGLAGDVGGLIGHRHHARARRHIDDRSIGVPADQFQFFLQAVKGAVQVGVDDPVPILRCAGRDRCVGGGNAGVVDCKVQLIHLACHRRECLGYRRVRRHIAKDELRRSPQYL